MTSIREALAIVVDFNLPAERIVHELDRIAHFPRLSPQPQIRQWSGVHLVALAEWAEQHSVTLSSSNRATYAERFH